MSQDPNNSRTAIISAFIGALGVIIAAFVGTYIANEKDRQIAELKKDLDNCKAGSKRLPAPVTNSVGSLTSTSISEGISPKSDTIPQLPIESREGEHYVIIDSALGDNRNHTVTVKFKVANEMGDSFGYLYLPESNAFFSGAVFKAIRGRLGDKRIEGSATFNYTPMKIHKNEPVNGSLIYGSVPSNVRKFSRVIIRVGRDEVSLGPVPIQW